MKRMLLNATIAFLPLFCGCASCMSRVYAAGSRPRYYPGTRNDAFCISQSFNPDEKMSLGRRLGLTFFSLIDIPFSTVFDTILLPVDHIGAYEPRNEDL
jgi:uncharacterized protein YceK